jgi:hypothetical protein
MNYQGKRPAAIKVRAWSSGAAIFCLSSYGYAEREYGNPHKT